MPVGVVPFTVASGLTLEIECGLVKDRSCNILPLGEVIILGGSATDRHIAGDDVLLRGVLVPRLFFDLLAWRL